MPKLKVVFPFIQTEPLIVDNYCFCVQIKRNIHEQILSPACRLRVEKKFFLFAYYPKCFSLLQSLSQITELMVSKLWERQTPVGVFFIWFRFFKMVGKTLLCVIGTHLNGTAELKQLGRDCLEPRMIGFICKPLKWKRISNG